MKKDNRRFDPARRSLIKGAAVTASAVAAGTLLGARQAAAAKAPKAAMMYQDKPHGSQQCSNCIHFIRGASAGAMGTCTVVAGAISPHGWCVAYAPKS